MNYVELRYFLFLSPVKVLHFWFSAGRLFTINSRFRLYWNTQEKILCLQTTEIIWVWDGACVILTSSVMTVLFLSNRDLFLLSPSLFPGLGDDIPHTFVSYGSDHAPTSPLLSCPDFKWKNEQIVNHKGAVSIMLRQLSRFCCSILKMPVLLLWMLPDSGPGWLTKEPLINCF